MKVISTLILVILTLLSVSAGISKIVLLEQDVEFFGKFGFSDPALIGFGLAQLLGGLLLISIRTRFIGAAVVGVTFLVSLALLLVDGNLPISIITAVATLLLGIVMKQSWKPAAQ